MMLIKPCYSLGLCLLTSVLTSKKVNSSTLRDSDFAEERTSLAKSTDTQANHLGHI